MCEKYFVDIKLFNGVKYKIFLPFSKTDYIQKIIYESKQPYELEMLSDMINRVNKSDDGVIVDIGMNIANHSLFFAANGFNVIAFEANKKMISIANRSIEKNNFQDKITVFNYGISDVKEMAYFDKEYDWNYGGMRLTIDNNKKNGIQCIPLDNMHFDKQVLILKIDVEGMELKVLKGAIKTICKYRPLIYIEGNYVADFIEIDRFLFENNYVHWDVFGESPTHLYLPIEKANLNLAIYKCLSEIEKIKLFFTVFQQNSYIHNKLSKLDKQCEYSEIILSNQSKDYRNTLSYMWGNRLINSTKSLSNFFKLPYHLYKDYIYFKMLKK
ncbi:TPA: FkbM family methyltransferase [Campylobacter jejuni]